MKLNWWLNLSNFFVNLFLKIQKEIFSIVLLSIHLLPKEFQFSWKRGKKTPRYAYIQTGTVQIQNAGSGGIWEVALQTWQAERILGSNERRGRGKKKMREKKKRCKRQNSQGDFEEKKRRKESTEGRRTEREHTRAAGALPATAIRQPPRSRSPPLSPPRPRTDTQTRTAGARPAGSAGIPAPVCVAVRVSVPAPRTSPWRSAPAARAAAAESCPRSPRVARGWMSALAFGVFGLVFSLPAESKVRVQPIHLPLLLQLSLPPSALPPPPNSPLSQGAVCVRSRRAVGPCSPRPGRAPALRMQLNATHPTSRCSPRLTSCSFPLFSPTCYTFHLRFSETSNYSINVRA